MKIILSACAVLVTSYFQLHAQGSWMRKADLGGNVRTKGVGFSIGEKGYVSTGQVGLNPYLKDLWEYNPPADTWTRKTDFPGTARTGAIAFSIGNKGYVGLGDDDSGNYEKDFWEYDPLTDTWIRKADFAGVGRRFAVAFSIGNKGYVGTGDSGSGFINDFWEYDPSADTWTPLSSFPGTGRKYAAGFAINGRGYIGAGTPSSIVNDFWEYTPSSNIWTPKSDFPSPHPEGSSAFTIDNYGYMGTGNDWSTFSKKFWRYDPTVDLWTPVTDFGGTGREHGVAFTVCGKGYVGAGGQDASPNFRDFWEYTPENYVHGNCCTQPVANFISTATVFCDSACINFTDSSRNSPTSWLWTFPGAIPSASTLQNPTNICYFSPGFYDVTLIVSNGGCTDTISKFNYIIVNDSCNFIVASDTSLCSGDCVVFSAAIPSSAYELEWSFPGGIPSILSDNPVTVCYYQDGTFDASLTYIDSIIQDTIYLQSRITVDSPSPLTATASDTLVEQGSSVQLTASGVGTIVWNPANQLSCNGCPNPIALVNQSTIFFATLTDQNGCESFDSVEVKIIESECENAILLPSAFSPNGDSHNEFIHAYVNGDVTDFNLKVFNRWGEVVFESNLPETKWDGNYKGVAQDIQVFAYIVQYTCNDENFFKTGNITLVR